MSRRTHGSSCPRWTLLRCRPSKAIIVARIPLRVQLRTAAETHTPKWGPESVKKLEAAVRDELKELEIELLDAEGGE